MIKIIPERDLFLEDTINPLNQRVVILAATEEFLCKKFNVVKSENKCADLIFAETKKLFDEIKEKINKKENLPEYKTISPRLDAVILADTKEGEETLSSYISTEMDIVSA